ncbi:DUF2059 domain-containing protein [Sulfitobacter sabulilitoris]|uniref:DUF2059 domain-containing protein n=1 Tax=Sulfitobacter sabulilitoris TaxID=2562655 RepID=A0A5S3PQ40_9RHOB|nr:DUF2059 domain-containing protein [Sulfitobacter sabulilitoris]TMM54655.1 DUF2059 domain-containing protein [Sulfitobacter sabulilitoris]
MTAALRQVFSLTCLIALFVLLSLPVRAAERAQIERFLAVTGFDVALDSLRLSAESAPQMVGMQAEDFGSEWTRLVDELFDPQTLRAMAMDILSETLDERLLTDAVDFYGSDLGQRLVAAENLSHMIEDDTAKRESGEAIVDGLVRLGLPRLEILKRLNRASGSVDTSVRAIHEVQVRFLMAAAAAGLVELRMDEADLRAALAADADALRLSLQRSGLAASAYTYQAFSDAEMTTYAEALEQPGMQSVYELMNAVQFEIMANRYEAVARRLQSMQPSQDL